MTKYSSEFKINVVSRYLTGDISYKDLCALYGISSISTAEKWVQRAGIHGLKSLKVHRTKTNYNQNFKIAVVEYRRTNPVSLSQTAAHFGINLSQVSSWNKIFKEQGVVGLRPRQKGRLPMTKHKKTNVQKYLEPTQKEKYEQEILKLKQELHEAELDRDILKTLATLTKNSKKHYPQR